MLKPIYLDHHATTPVDPRVLRAMLPYFSEYFGNPGSTHYYGWEAQAAIDQARQAIAGAINGTPAEIIFTSGATEANNLAIKGVAEANLAKGRHIITVQTEHQAVLDPCSYLQSLGFEVTYLPVDHLGELDLQQLQAAIRADTILVSVMAANNEIGTLMPLAKIGQICSQAGVIFHSDAAQAIGKIPLDVQAMQIDLLGITGHKLYGPKGIGALYVRRRIAIAPQLHGGGQERGMRAGTLYPPQIVGLAKAIELAMAEMEQEQLRIRQLRDQLWQGLENLPAIQLNGSLEQRLAGNLNCSFGQIFPNKLMSGLRQTVALSSGSACSSGKASHVLRALGRSPSLAQASLRFGIGRFNTEAEIAQVIGAVRASVLDSQNV
ncbi:MAG: cysteine desulfurase family protein [Pseudanabaenaceae cyanobacterium bins.68]|nr:cysteine desulfurase family protein [Pseudanabaenaceae cyanobacterium bins.68]